MDIYEIRRTNLKALCEKYERTRIAELMGYQDTNYLNGLYSGHNSFGFKTARKMEKALRLESGWIDLLHTGRETHHVNESAAEYETNKISQILKKFPELLKIIEIYQLLSPGGRSAVMTSALKEWEHTEEKHRGTVDGDNGIAHA